MYQLIVVEYDDYRIMISWKSKARYKNDVMIEERKNSTSEQAEYKDVCMSVCEFMCTCGTKSYGSCVTICDYIGPSMWNGSTHLPLTIVLLRLVVSRT